MKRTPEQQAVYNMQAAKWLEMKLTGLTYRQIASEVGVSATYVHQVVSGEIAKIPTEAATELKTQMLEQLDMDYHKLQSIATHVCNEECFEMNCKVDAKTIASAITTRLRIQESKRKLLGLDAAEKVEVVDATPSHIKEMLSAARAANREVAEELLGVPSEDPTQGEEK